jgi:hypothetical protein
MRTGRVCLLGVLVAVLGAISAWSLARAAEPAKAEAGKAFALRVNVGGSEYKDPRGNVWKADKEFAKGSFGYVDGDDVDRGEDVKIKNTDMPKIFQNERYGLTGYKVTVPAPGKYTVALLWAETYDGIGGPGERVFNVSINGKKVLDKFDPTKAAGGVLTAVAKTCVVDAPESLIKIDLEEDTQSPMLNGLVVLSGDGETVQKAATEGITKAAAPAK